MTRVREAAGGAPNIVLRGRVPQAELVALLQRARAFVFAAEEDFGHRMVEAQACGTPLIAYRRGGAARHRAGGRDRASFPSRTGRQLVDAVRRYEAASIPPEAAAPMRALQPRRLRARLDAR
jgi:glycosyltransferase involved in cell wall biosynthesis